MINDSGKDNDGEEKALKDDDGEEASIDNLEVPPPAMSQPHKWVDKGSAKKEAENFANQNELRDQRTENEKRWLQVLGWILPAILMVFSFAFVAAFFCWAWHHLTPDEWQWLSKEQVSNIQSLIFSGSLGAIVSGTLRKKLTNQ